MNIRSRLKNLLTTNDRRRVKRDVKAGRHVNIFALSIEFQAADKVHTALDFVRYFNATGPNHTIAKKLWPGELDVKYGHWVKGDGPTFHCEECRTTPFRAPDVCTTAWNDNDWHYYITGRETR